MLRLGVVGAGVEALVDHDPLVALDLNIVLGRVDLGALVSADERAGCATNNCAVQLLPLSVSRWAFRMMACAAKTNRARCKTPRDGFDSRSGVLWG